MNAYNRPPAIPHLICADCNSLVAQPKQPDNRNGMVWIWVLGLILLPFLIGIFILIAGAIICPSVKPSLARCPCCGGKTLIPIASPRGRELFDITERNRT